MMLLQRLGLRSAFSIKSEKETFKDLFKSFKKKTLKEKEKKLIFVLRSRTKRAQHNNIVIQYGGTESGREVYTQTY
ncbi:hypothetical protein CampHawk_107 [Bacillus phage CampHawk]|uniref:Uncharacterized protein n=1 Tax=Bacillus phage CampHawk TaxID=1406783 RepID=U5PSU4_9CAUD|nr:hypothetical protein CampHawk_107 [Bacillus phage CampHawk]AGY46985.1 hypothetical protein CampHawk_107 [Bacillus phage CampHawk]